MRLINYSFLFFLLASVSCCKQTTKSKFISSVKEINNITIVKEQVKLNRLKGQWFYNNKPFNGFAVAYYENKITSEKIGFFKGKINGL